MIAFLFKFGDLISALLGLVAAIVLAWPAITAVSAKRNWEALHKIEKDSGDDPQVAEAMKEIRRFADAPLLGDSRGAAMTNLWGFGFLGLSFVFLLIASIGRALNAG